jgi:RHS repeat-associated protein
MTKATGTHLHFYQAEQLHTVLGATTCHTLFRNQDRPLAEQHGTTRGTVHLLSTDAQNSMTGAHTEQGARSFSYTPYGHSPLREASGILTGFSGEARDRATGYYLPGKGYRAFHPILMRFNAPDSYSPFAQGGVNAYMYCAGDPVNHTDPTGHAPVKKLPALQQKPVKKRVNDRRYRPRQKPLEAQSTFQPNTRTQPLIRNEGQPSHGNAEPSYTDSSYSTGLFPEHLRWIKRLQERIPEIASRIPTPQKEILIKYTQGVIHNLAQDSGQHMVQATGVHTASRQGILIRSTGDAIRNMTGKDLVAQLWKELGRNDPLPRSVQSIVG